MSAPDDGVKDYDSSCHAQHKLHRRGIDIELVRQVLANPQQTFEVRTGRIVVEGREVLEGCTVRIRYDEDVDAITIVFQPDREIQVSDEPNPGVVMDYDVEGTLVSIEVLDASKRFQDLESVQYEKTSSQG